jgi:2-dehydropantoate 2-reductase
MGTTAAAVIAAKHRDARDAADPVGARSRHQGRALASVILLALWGGAALTVVTTVAPAAFRVLPTRALAGRMMAEAQAVAEALGVRFKISLEQRIAGAEAVGAHKTSMLQDVEAGRALELEALVGAVVELGRITGIPTPTISAIYATTSLLAKTLAAQGGHLRVHAG